MIFEYAAPDAQTINPGESAIFTVTLSSCPCGCGCVRHFDGESGFLLAGGAGGRSGCGCRQRTRNFFVDFGANVGIPEGGTAAPVQVAITREGETLPYTTMQVEPAVGELANISRATQVPIWTGCCQTVSVRNIGTTPITMQNANIVIDPRRRGG